MVEIKQTNKEKAQELAQITEENKKQLAQLGFDKIQGYVNAKVEDYMKNGLELPQGYKANNAVIQAAMIIAQDKKMAECNSLSISEAMVDMVIQGLNPAQKQCYFIPYAGRLTLSVSTWGQETALKRITGVIDLKSQVIYDGDVVDYEVIDGAIKNLTHETTFTNRLNEIVGVYAIIELDEEVFGRSQHIEIMTIDEIKDAWGMGHANGKSKAHNNFPQEMAKKSVRNRAMKQFINSTTFKSEEQPLIEAYQRSVENDYIVNDNREIIEAEVEEQNFISEPPTEKVYPENEAESYFDSVNEEEATQVDVESLLD